MLVSPNISLPDVHPGARSPPFEGEQIELNRIISVCLSDAVKKRLQRRYKVMYLRFHTINNQTGLLEKFHPHPADLQKCSG